MDVSSLFDARTLAIMSGVFRLSAGLIVIAFQNNITTAVSDRNRKVQNIWGFGNIIIGVGITLTGLRYIVPDFASVNIGNIFIILGAATTAFSYSVYGGISSLRKMTIVIGVLGAVLFNLVDISMIHDRIRLRSVVTLSALVIIQMIIIVALLRADRPRTGILLFLVFAHAVSILPFCIRLYEVIFLGYAEVLRSTIGVAALFLGVSMISFMIVPTFILLLKEDSDRSLITKEREIARREAAVALNKQRLRAEESERVAQLARGIAHDFNNLLSMIKFGLREIEDGLDTRSPEKLRKTSFDTIYRSLEQGITTTTGLMSLGLEQKVVCNKISITEALEDLRYLTGSRLPRSIQQEYGLDTACDLTAISNAPLLNMCLMNLVLNARDAMPSGGTLRITARIVDWAGVPSLVVGQLLPNTYVQIDISDTGSGIAPAQVAQIFDANFSQTRSRRGMGLGLFMVRQFIEKTGAGLYLRSKPSEGTTISLLLPCFVGAQDIIANETLDDPYVSVLIVDDDLPTRKSVQRLFLELGEIAAVAADGQEALARLNSFPNLCLVLTDFAMPGLDGIELMQKIKQRRADLPVVIMTNTHPDDFTDDMSNRCLILQKPLGLDALQKLQSDLLSETYAGSRGKEE
jgi:signal transduction histidine kinase/CheY-like chemotaxis protein